MVTNITRNEFAVTLRGAITGRHDDLEVILDLYRPLIEKYAHLQGVFDEDLHQYLLIHIALNINKFSL